MPGLARPVQRFVALIAVAIATLLSTGTAALAVGDPVVTVTGDAPGTLLPGSAPVALPVSLHNRSTTEVLVVGLTTSVRASSLPEGCSADWFRVAQAGVSPTSPVHLGPGASAVLPAEGVSAPLLQLVESHTNQDACQGATVVLDYALQTQSGTAGLLTPKVSWAAPAPITYGTALTPVQLAATSPVPGRFSYEAATGTVLPAGVHTLVAHFTPTDLGSYGATTVTTTLVVNRATPTVSWAPPATMVAGSVLTGAQLDATSSVPGTFAYTPALGSTVVPGSTRLDVVLTPTDRLNYSTGTAHVTVHADPAASPSPAPTGTTPPSLSVQIAGRPGIAVVNGRVMVKASGLLPGSTVSAWAHSTPVLLGTSTADHDGRLSTSFALPPGLGAGAHRVEVTGTSAGGSAVSRSYPFTVAHGDRLGSVGRVPRQAFASLVPFDPVANEPLILRVTAAGAALLGALGAAVRGSGRASRARAGAAESGGTSKGSETSETSETSGTSETAEGGKSEGGAEGGSEGGSEGGGTQGAFLADVELERALVHRSGTGRGDRSGTWAWRFTRHVDAFSVYYPERLAALSPAVARVSVDGDYLRAMFGGLTLLLYPLAIALGIASCVSSGGAALPPAPALFAGVLALSIFDSMVGYVAGLTFAAAVLAAGGVSTATDVRELSGVVLVWFSVPLAAGAVRPLRRHIHLRPDSLWDRGADYVISALFGAWLTAEMVELLSPLAGFEVPLSELAWSMALVTAGVVGIRMVLETIATHHYPDRLQALRHKGSTEDSSDLQGVLSFFVQVSVYVFIAAAYMKFDWPLYAGTALFYLPLLPSVIVNRLPKSRFVAKWMPAGLTTWTFVIASGVLLARLLEHTISDPSLAESIGFILEPLPILLIWGLEMFSAEEDEEEAEHAEHGEDPEAEGRFPMTWLLRLAGVPAVLLCVYLVANG